MQAYDRMAEAGRIDKGANATASVLQASFLGRRAPGTSYFRSKPTTCADVKNEGASGDDQPLSDGKALEQANDIFNMAGSVPQGMNYAGANLPTQGSAPTSSAPPKQSGFKDEPKHSMSEQDGSVVYYKLPRPAWKNYKLPRPAWKKVPFFQPTKRQLVQEVEQLKAQLRIQSKRHPGQRERTVHTGCRLSRKLGLSFRSSKRQTRSWIARPAPRQICQRTADEWKDENLYPPLRQSPKKCALLAVPKDEPDLSITFAPQAYGLN